VRVARISTGHDVPVAAVETDGALHPLGADLPAIIDDGGPDPAAAGAAVDAHVRLAPVAPRKVVAIGLNYLDHIRESGLEQPTRPLVFAKFPSSIVGPDAPIRIPGDLTQRVDWEVELGVVIGRTARAVSVEDALGHVFGYTVGNDVSARDLQFGDGQWVRGKSLDTFCPVGPVIVTADEIPDPQSLRLTCSVNGEVMQDATTGLMVFGVAELISFCSHSFTLEPGDLLLTGTPWGCGEFMDPKRSLAPGDVVECEIEGIGTLRNPVVDAADA
jgi:2-keto-4-pentenoate hydratase/2-oxohepta-3-ene-1,7-dioic acid hydratase in catechol pathway